MKDELVKLALFSVIHAWSHTDLFSILLLQTFSPKSRRTPFFIVTWLPNLELLKERKAEHLPDWLTRTTKSQISELKSFANGIRRDYAAVLAAFSLPWNNGCVEGHVNRLKFLKRQMFGWAHLDLLRVKSSMPSSH